MPLLEPSLAQPPTKRKGAESTPETVRTPGFWFDDGNVILQAQSTQFRVHRGIIARHSTVFRDMFALAQPEGEPMLDGCPVVHVTDAPSDWENLLTVLYNPETIYQPKGVFALPVLSSILRLGRKYELDKFYNAAIKWLECEVPTSLELWDEKLGVNSEPRSPLIGKEVELLNILLEIGIQRLLPVTYFLCLKNMTLIEILQGQLPSTESAQEGGTRHWLSLDSVRTLIIGREKAGEAMMQHTFGWLRDSAGLRPRCLDRETCSNYLTMIRDHFLSELTVTYVGDVFEPPRVNGCEPCTADIAELYEAGRQKVWGELPAYFGLPEWEDLL